MTKANKKSKGKTKPTNDKMLAENGIKKPTRESTRMKHKKANTKPTKTTDGWQDIVVKELAKAVKLLGLDAKSTPLDLDYPVNLIPAVNREDFVSDKELWIKLEKRFPKIIKLGVSNGLYYNIGYPLGHKYTTVQIDIGKVRKPSKKPCKTAINLMAEDAQTSRIEDEELAKRGFLKPKKDIFRDDCCYGCRFTIENRDDNLGPFDRRFYCQGVTRIIHVLKEAIATVEQVSRFDTQASSVSGKHITNELLMQRLLEAQSRILYAGNMIAERVATNHLECVTTHDRPSCYVAS